MTGGFVLSVTVSVLIGAALALVFTLFACFFCWRFSRRQPVRSKVYDLTGNNSTRYYTVSLFMGSLYLHEGVSASFVNSVAYGRCHAAGVHASASPLLSFDCEGQLWALREYVCSFSPRLTHEDIGAPEHL